MVGLLYSDFAYFKKHLLHANLICNLPIVRAFAETNIVRRALGLIL